MYQYNSFPVGRQKHVTTKRRTAVCCIRLRAQPIFRVGHNDLMALICVFPREMSCFRVARLFLLTHKPKLHKRSAVRSAVYFYFDLHTSTTARSSAPRNNVPAVLTVLLAVLLNFIFQAELLVTKTRQNWSVDRLRPIDWLPRLMLHRRGMQRIVDTCTLDVGRSARTFGICSRTGD